MCTRKWCSSIFSNMGLHLFPPDFVELFCNIHVLEQNLYENPLFGQFLITDIKLLLPDYLSQFSQVGFLVHSSNSLIFPVNGSTASDIFVIAASSYIVTLMLLSTSSSLPSSGSCAPTLSFYALVHPIVWLFFEFSWSIKCVSSPTQHGNSFAHTHWDANK